MGTDKKERKMKVYAQSGYRYKQVPAIIIKGEYLKQMGFEAGTPIKVCLSEGKIEIVKQEDGLVISHH